VADEMKVGAVLQLGADGARAGALACLALLITTKSELAVGQVPCESRLNACRYLVWNGGINSHHRNDELGQLTRIM
jgi:hypothetical protein